MSSMSCPTLEKEERKVPRYKLEELLLLSPIGFSMKPPLDLYVDRTLLLRIGLPNPFSIISNFNPYIYCRKSCVYNPSILERCEHLLRNLF